MSTLPQWIAAALLAASAVFAYAPAWGLPAIGGRIPDAQIEDADGRATALRALLGRPVLVMYEDRGSSAQNAALKRDLSALAASVAGARPRPPMAILAVADVAAYDYWPVRGFVRSAIRDESAKVGTTIYCDWTGAFRDAFAFRRGVSNVVLVGRDGRVLFAREGALAVAERQRVIDLLRAQM